MLEHVLLVQDYLRQKYHLNQSAVNTLWLGVTVVAKDSLKPSSIYKSPEFPANTKITCQL